MRIRWDDICLGPFSPFTTKLLERVSPSGLLFLTLPWRCSSRSQTASLLIKLVDMFDLHHTWSVCIINEPRLLPSGTTAPVGFHDTSLWVSCFLSWFCVDLFLWLPHTCLCFLGVCLGLFSFYMLLWLVILHQIYSFVIYIEFQAHIFNYFGNSPWKSDWHPTQHVQSGMYHPTPLGFTKFLLLYSQ